ncbi:hypothetical protein N2601_08650 [Rhizobium sp. CB3060]|uniref:hypothetical protein n=1 Tax=Rhizobium sp. CB3060 TaxID=3138255 RepID=UPI0021A2E671|nr:hypothetical protein [Rhizobium tropici]UWU22998.1 hypothetical protein N2601_08650 [Rhizobium tropici]
MPSEHFSGHTLTKVKNQIKKGVSAAVVYRDQDTTGLAIKITKTGASWYYSTRDTNLQIAPFSHFGLDDLPMLRELVVKIKKAAKAGQPIEILVKSFAAGHSVQDAKHLHDVATGQGVTWEVGRDLYLEWCGRNRNPDTARGYKSALGATPGLHDDFAPIHGKPLAAILTRDLAQVRDNIVSRCTERAIEQHQARDTSRKDVVSGIRQADLTVSALKAAFKHFVNKKQFNLDRNPAADLSKCLERPTEIAGKDKFRALTQIEIGALWEALEACPNETVRGVLKLQLLTGQRRTTPTIALQSAFQFDSGAYDCIWGLEDKSHHWRKLALPPLAANIVRHALRMATNNPDSNHLFPKQRPKKQGDTMEGHINVRTVSDGIEDMRKPGGVFELMPFNVSTHDLRKAFVSIAGPKMSQFILRGRPMDAEEVEMITHKNEGRESVAQLVYDKNSYLDVKLEILTWWQEYVLEGHRMYVASLKMKEVA